MSIKNLFITSLTVLIIIILIVFFVKGNVGNPIAFQNDNDARVTGPFEATNSSSRYALIQALVDNKTPFFNDKLAGFSAPDISYYNGHYISIFTPGVSFLGIPFYIIGKYIGFPQLITYMLTLFSLFLNFFLVFKLSQKFVTNRYASLIGALIFVFATNSLAYALTLTQHQISTSIILLALFNALAQKRTIINNIILGALFGIGALVDIPNMFALIPILIYVFLKHFTVRKTENKLNIGVKISMLAFVIGLIPFFVLFANYNYQATGSYTKLGQIIGRSNFPNDIKKPETRAKVETNVPGHPLPLDTRVQLHSFYILIISNERGVLYYSPVILIGLLGLFMVYRKSEKSHMGVVLLATVSMIVVFYSMHGDPWGGWSYGARYMIPVYAILATGIGVVLTKYKKNLIFLPIFSVLLIYSVYVSILGALTTNSIAPKVEAINLETPISYTYEYNQQFVSKNQSSSLVYNLYLKDQVPLSTYLYVLMGVIVILVGINYLLVIFEVDKNDK